MKLANGEMETAQKHIQELEKAETPLLKALVPLKDPAAATPLLEQLKQPPDISRPVSG